MSSSGSSEDDSTSASSSDSDSEVSTDSEEERRRRRRRRRKKRRRKRKERLLLKYVPSHKYITLCGCVYVGGSPQTFKVVCGFFGLWDECDAQALQVGRQLQNP